jgi:hypothetical protein
MKLSHLILPPANQESLRWSHGAQLITPNVDSNIFIPNFAPRQPIVARQKRS